MEALAVVVARPEVVELSRLSIGSVGEHEILVGTEWSGISTGTERLLWQGRMPPFPGMGYPLVPGYESVGRVLSAPSDSDFSEGDSVFVPGARCFGEVRGLFGGAASHLIVDAERLVALPANLGEQGILLALAATAWHVFEEGKPMPELIVGHGVLGRLIARIAVARGGEPTVWENNPKRLDGAHDYRLVHPDQDQRQDYGCICDASGDVGILDVLIGRLRTRGEIVIAGFYAERPSFNFPPAFMKEIRIRVSAEWQRQDLLSVRDLIAEGNLSLEGLITHRHSVEEGVTTIAEAYRTAFDEPACLKMLLDWRSAQ